MTLSMTCASRGSRSQTFRPGTLEAMQPSSPRISSGASGLGSKVSSWLGEPYMNRRTLDSTCYDTADLRIVQLKNRANALGFRAGRMERLARECLDEEAVRDGCGGPRV